MRGKLTSKLYGDARTRATLLDERAAITAMARDFEGDSYDLADEADREHLQSRMLSYVRAPTRDVLLALAKSYHDRFGRRLPVVSLIRTERYQRSLSEVNANATKVMLAHTTGQAFDITYRYMANDEQNFLMQDLARLEEAGRVEALRENRNCFHVLRLPIRNTAAGSRNRRGQGGDPGRSRRSRAGEAGEAQAEAAKADCPEALTGPRASTARAQCGCARVESQD